MAVVDRVIRAVVVQLHVRVTRPDELRDDRRHSEVSGEHHEHDGQGGGSSQPEPPGSHERSDDGAEAQHNQGLLIHAASVVFDTDRWENQRRHDDDQAS